MRNFALPLIALWFATPVPVAAQDHGHATHNMPQGAAKSGDPAGQPADDAKNAGSMDHGMMDHSVMDHSPKDHDGMSHDETGHRASSSDNGQPPARAMEGPVHAADGIYGRAVMRPARDTIARENGGMTTATFMIDRAETRIGEGQNIYLWDLQAWYGGDIDKLWLKSEGEGAFGGGVEGAEVQALWSHAIGAWFDVQAGLRHDSRPDRRTHAVLGVQGLAPYFFELDAAAFLSDKGEMTARVEAEYDQRITQRLILQPRAELSMSAQNVPEIGLGAGLTSIEAGLRLRYEFSREFAPYIGIDYESRLGETADIARTTGEDPDRLSLLLGLRTWF